MTLQQLRYVIAVADHGSMNEAAKALFISQPSLSGAVKELEKELGFELFLRTSRGIVVTPDGEEFLGYARQVTEQYRLLRNRYIEKESREKFSVSMQHYSFAVKAFVETVKRAGWKITNLLYMRHAHMKSLKMCGISKVSLEFYI